jgi:hypothetical protein
MSPLWLLFSYHAVHFMLYFKLACLAYCYFSVKLACLAIFLVLKCLYSFPTICNRCCLYYSPLWQHLLLHFLLQPNISSLAAAAAELNDMQFLFSSLLSSPLYSTTLFLSTLLSSYFYVCQQLLLFVLPMMKLSRPLITF